MNIVEKIKNYYSRAYKNQHFPPFKTILFSDKKIIAYLGHLGDKNFGDELVYEASKALFPTYTLVPVLRHSPLPYLLFQKLVRSKMKGIIVGGGTLIGPRFMDLDVFEELVGDGKPVYLHGTGVHKKGAIHAGWGRELKKKVYGGIRGPMSKRNLQEIDVDVKIVGDGAFALFDRARKDQSNNKNVLINIGTHEKYDGEQNARTQLDLFIEYLLSGGYNVQFLPFSNIDSDLGLTMRTKYPQINILQIPETYAEAVSHYDDSCFAVGERLHFNIMSLLGACPFISINYDKKHEDFLASISLQEMGILPSDISLQKLIDAFEKRNNWDFAATSALVTGLKNDQFNEASLFAGKLV